mgnify:CR=1 FL=1
MLCYTSLTQQNLIFINQQLKSYLHLLPDWYKSCSNPPTPGIQIGLGESR